MIRIDRFDMSDMDDRSNAERRDKADNMAGCLIDLGETIRSKFKHSDSPTTTWDMVRDMFYEICKGYDIDPWEL